MNDGAHVDSRAVLSRPCEEDRLRAALERLVEAARRIPTIKNGPFGYEHGLCYWCEGGWEDVPGPRGGTKYTGAHRDGCAYGDLLQALGDLEAAGHGFNNATQDSLDAAWAEAEALVPPGYRLDLSYGCGTREHPDWLYHASCRAKGDYLGYIGHNPGGPTPAAALRALAARLKEGKSGG